MAVTNTPEGTMIIYALSLGHKLAQRVAKASLIGSGLRGLATEVEAAFAEAKQAVIDLEAKAS